MHYNVGLIHDPARGCVAGLQRTTAIKRKQPKTRRPKKKHHGKPQPVGKPAATDTVDSEPAAAPSPSAVSPSAAPPPVRDTAAAAVKRPAPPQPSPAPARKATVKSVQRPALPASVQPSEPKPAATPGLALRACDAVLDIARNEPRRMLLWILGIYGGLWFVAAFSFPSLPAVGYEMALRGHEWPTGPWSDPPLAPWLTQIAALITGGWTGSQIVLSIGSALLALLLLWRLGAGMIGRSGATLAVALTILIGCFGAEILGYDPAIAALPLSVAAVALYRRAVLSTIRAPWIALGLVCGLLGNAEHAGFALILVLVAHLLLTPEGRRQVLTPGPVLAAALAIAVLTPHLLWLAQPGAATAEGVGARIVAAFGFLSGQVGLHLGLIGLAVLAALPRLPLQGEPAQLTLQAPSGFDRSLILAAAFGPSLLVALGSVVGWFSIGATTGSALAALSGLALLMLLPPQFALRAPRLAVVLWLLVLVGAPFVAIGSIYSRAYGSGPLPTELYPTRALSNAMQAVWKSRTTRQLDIVTGSARQAGFVALYASPRPSVFIDADVAKSPWISPQRLKQSGTLVVWTTDEFARTDELPPPYRAALGEVAPVFGTMVLPLGRGKLKAYGWAMIPPEGVTVQGPAAVAPPVTPPAAEVPSSAQPSEPADAQQAPPSVSAKPAPAGPSSPATPPAAN
ncbi:glycosyltransferase family 39 protein [Rhodopseudomonas sp. HC1]|uniref:glycosyltransferase family 39 protein n=1 Tax=Rhodopseudomonas infernalis TaxID=2897386 RepID=UPI001EE83E59|nr:glycosyltransferase family 39 protein [Rhodopseudomonas infernalis]MCG6204028.1 glycosyltransferase family 39 protein [Rhodopseudomonas infernalis]